VRVKEIEFEQVGLVELHTFPEAHRFFLLSVDNGITVWDYDKLAILNRIDLQVCVPSIISGGISLIPEHINQCLLVHSGRGVAIITLDPSGSVQDVTIMEFPDGSPLVAVALLL
jgi:hypothetical protein